MDRYLELLQDKRVLELEDVLRRQTFMLAKIVALLDIDSVELITHVDKDLLDDMSHTMIRNRLKSVNDELAELYKQGIRCIGSQGHHGVSGVEITESACCLCGDVTESLLPICTICLEKCGVNK